MSDILLVVVPVFLVVAAGYLAAWRGIIAPEGIDGLMKFAQSIAVPMLLFRAISTLDLATVLDPRLLIAFYGGAVTGFVVGLTGARFLFGRTWDDAVAIGFVGLFSNSLLLGLPITERAYGPDALAANFAIIAFHAPFCYILGITVMELVRAQGTALAAIPGKVARAVLVNPLIIGVLLGFAVNLTGLWLPEPVTSALDLIARAGIPAALFGLGGVLLRYKPEGDMRVILFIVGVSVMLHPTVVWFLGHALGLSIGDLRSAVITASVAPGVNAYLFADMYGRARRVAASAVLIGTACTLLSASFWLWMLP